MTVKPITQNKKITISTIECVLHAKLRNMTCQGLDRQGQGQGLTSLTLATLATPWLCPCITRYSTNATFAITSVSGRYNVPAANHSSRQTAITQGFCSVTMSETVRDMPMVAMEC